MTRNSSFMSASLVVTRFRGMTLSRLKCQWPQTDLEECEPSRCACFGGAPSSDRCARTSAAWPMVSAIGRIAVHVEDRQQQPSLPQQWRQKLLQQCRPLPQWHPRLLQCFPRWSLLQLQVSKVSARQRHVQYVFRIGIRCSMMTIKKSRMVARQLQWRPRLPQQCHPRLPQQQCPRLQQQR